jgi:hypothetical protein
MIKLIDSLDGTGLPGFFSFPAFFAILDFFPCLLANDHPLPFDGSGLGFFGKNTFPSQSVHLFSEDI